jgi:hypothetical protein
VDKNVEYGRIYSEIANGFSTETIDNQNVYFKHPSLSDHFGLHRNYDFIIKEAQKRGLPTEEEQVNFAIEGGWWTEQKESEINILRKTVINLTKTKGKLFLPSQKASIDKQIHKNEAILLTFIKERKEIVGYTAEEFASDRYIDDTIVYVSYKNKELTIKAFSQEEYYNLSDRYIQKIKDAYSKYSILFNHEVIKRIAASGFFQNLVYLNEDAYGFWGKPTASCTKYQIDLLVYGKMYKNVIKSYAENGKPIQDDILSDADKFVQWIESQSSGGGEKSNNSKRESTSNRVTSYVGATKQDLKQMGIETEKFSGGKTLLQMAKESGGVLEKHEYLKARESS